MNKSAKTWLLFMMIPFFIGVLIHFLVPLQIIISANPKLEETYNGYKIEVEQNTVRALAFLNARVITNRVQMYENIRSTIIRLFVNNQNVEDENLTSVKMNSAFEVANNANVNSNYTYERNVSMWYSPGVDSVENMTDIQMILYRSYILAEPFITAVFSSTDEVYSGLIDLEVMTIYNGTYFNFQYPTIPKEEFKAENASLRSSYYDNALKNYLDQGYLMTIFDEGRFIKSCTLVLRDGLALPLGIVCLGLDISIVIRDITSVLGVPSFELSTNDYYIIRPFYRFENKEYPQIIANFSNLNLSKVDTPEETYFSLQDHPLPVQIFTSARKYSMNIQRHERTKTYYTIPITTTNYYEAGQTTFFLVVSNNFANADLVEQSRSSQILTIMIVPSIMLLFVSIIVTTLILKSILRKLDNALKLMGEYCSLIWKGDLKLEIQEYDETEDIKELFIELDKLNQLNKYTDMKYFKVPKPERIVRYLYCIKLFDDLGYDKTNLYENIADCYMEIGDLQNAIVYLRQSIEMTIKEVYGNELEICRIYEKQVGNKQRVDKSTRRKERSIKRKILKLCLYLYTADHHQSENADYQKVSGKLKKELIQKADLLRKIIYPDVFNYEYIYCLLYIVGSKVRCNDFEGIEVEMESLKELIIGYEEIHKGDLNCLISPDLLFSYWYYNRAIIKFHDKNYLESYESFIRSLQGNEFHPLIHNSILVELKKILQIHGIKTEEIEKLRFTHQYRPRTDREYIFLMDVGKPEMGVQQINDWKRKAREMADHIFNKLVKGNDRISIIEYCLDIKIVCNLIEKGNREKILKKELMSSIKARDQTINALMVPCLRKVIDRVKNLKKEKVFIVFVKGKIMANCHEIYEEISEVENSRFIFLTEYPQSLKDKNESLFVINLERKVDVDRILEEKIVKDADNIINLF